MARSRRELPFCRPVFLVSGRNRSDTVPYRGDLRRPPALDPRVTLTAYDLYEAGGKSARVDSALLRTEILC